MAERVMVNPHEPMMQVRQVLDSVRLGEIVPDATKEILGKFRYYVVTPDNQIIAHFT